MADDYPPNHARRRLSLLLMATMATVEHRGERAPGGSTRHCRLGMQGGDEQLDFPLRLVTCRGEHLGEVVGSQMWSQQTRGSEGQRSIRHVIENRGESNSCARRFDSIVGGAFLEVRTWVHYAKRNEQLHASRRRTSARSATAQGGSRVPFAIGEAADFEEELIVREFAERSLLRSHSPL